MIGNEATNGVGVSAGDTHTFGLNPSVSGVRTSAYPTVSLTPSRLFQSFIDSWSSFSSACLGSYLRFKASHWKGTHLLPLSLPVWLLLGLCIHRSWSFEQLFMGETKRVSLGEMG